LGPPQQVRVETATARLERPVGLGRSIGGEPTWFDEQVIDYLATRDLRPSSASSSRRSAGSRSTSRWVSSAWTDECPAAVDRRRNARVYFLPFSLAAPVSPLTDRSAPAASLSALDSGGPAHAPTRRPRDGSMQPLSSHDVPARLRQATSCGDFSVRDTLNRMSPPITRTTAMTRTTTTEGISLRMP
jgi:hypothetical protein